MSTLKATGHGHATQVVTCPGNSSQVSVPVTRQKMSRNDIQQENVRYPDFELAPQSGSPYAALQRINALEHTMEYFGFLSLGAAVAAIGLRCYFSMKERAVPQTQAEQHLSPRAGRVLESTITRRLLRYHRGLAQA